MKESIPVIISVILGCLLVFTLATEDQRLQGRVIGVTGQCADGSYTTAKRSQGACSSHGGVKRWIIRSRPTERIIDES